ncbi:MAG: efflux RND transporter periplasmic adaptor subunit [Gammaproteobacteria bacterium]|nr:efflux RND transporter periplasmic adaptor subunit [Gammaproteobacteria bacterium]
MSRTCCLVVALLVLLPPAAATAADVPAQVTWVQRVELGTLVSGVVSEVHVTPGQAVAEGEPLVSLDRRGFATQVSRRQAEHEHARAMLDEAIREDERAIELYDRTVLSDFERNQALVALKAARAAEARARAALVAARLDLERSVIRAPFAGAVLAVAAAPGQSVVSELQSRPLVTLADTARLRARGLVDAAQAARLQPGADVSATLRGLAVEARVAHIGYEPVATTAPGVHYELLVDLVAPPGRPLRVGETVNLGLE